MGGEQRAARATRSRKTECSTAAAADPIDVDKKGDLVLYHYEETKMVILLRERKRSRSKKRENMA